MLACAVAIPVSSHKAVLASAVVFLTFEVALAAAAAFLIRWVFLVPGTTFVVAPVVAVAFLVRRVSLVPVLSFEVALAVAAAFLA